MIKLDCGVGYNVLSLVRGPVRKTVGESVMYAVFSVVQNSVTISHPGFYSTRYTIKDGRNFVKWFKHND